MHAAVVESYNEPPVLQEMPEPKRRSGQALVKVTAATLNPVELSVASGRFYLGPPMLPYVAGMEGAGVVLEGETLQAGQRIRFFQDQAAYGETGAMAELTAVDEAKAVEVPDAVPDALAAALGVSAVAGWLSVEWRGALRPGEKVLVLGASGAVGQVAVQAAKLLGAGRVVAAGRHPDALRRAQALGADATVQIAADATPEKLAEAFREAADGPLDLVVDPLWGLPALGACLAAAQGGRIVNLGQSAGAEVPFPSGLLRGKMLTLTGYANFFVPAPIMGAACRRMLRHAAEGRLTADYEVIPLTEVAVAWRLQATSPHRKLILDPSR